MKKGRNKTPNRLINETSTYLLQHAYNPVDWHAWGPEALELSKSQDKPILLSVGYAACHWCHVMEHESFEDDEVAALMNANFVNIKVDREERTDLDDIYMKAVQMMTGHGGWPMTVFLTPELKPFFGGTYFPPDDRHGLPSFKRLLAAINEAWNTKRSEIEESSNDLVEHMKSFDQLSNKLGTGTIDYTTVDESMEKLLEHFDDKWGGFGGAPKFPHSFSIDLAMRCAVTTYKGKSIQSRCLSLINTTLDRMAYGGIHDQLAGGFARYSVDRQWLVPHFEKMLYDNALLCQSYLNGYVLTGRTYWADVARGILDFSIRELGTEDGAFYSSLDADSEGKEGTFYVWTPEQIVDALGKKDADFFCSVFGVTKNGNFEHGASVLNLKDSPEKTAEQYDLSVEEFWAKVAPMKEKLLKLREKRVRPGRDEKVLTSWNSLMISALVDGYRILKDPKYLQAAQKAAQFICTQLQRGDRLLRTWGQGKAKLDGYLDDYAYFSQALLDLASVDVAPMWIDRAIVFAHQLIELFWDDADGGLFYTSKEHEQLVTRSKALYDGSIPSGMSVAASVFARLATLTNDSEFRHRAEQLFLLYSPLMMRVPDQFANLLCAMEFHLADGPEIVVVGDQPNREDFSEMIYSINRNFIPHKSVLCWRTAELIGDRRSLAPILQGKTALDGKATAYVCRNFSCVPPVNDPAAVLKLIKET